MRKRLCPICGREAVKKTCGQPLCQYEYHKEINRKIAEERRAEQRDMEHQLKV